MRAAASRETYEEAGVLGNVEVNNSISSTRHDQSKHASKLYLFLQGMLGKWLNKEQDKIHYMFAMRATEELQQWPERNARERKWVSLIHISGLSSGLLQQASKQAVV